MKLHNPHRVSQCLEGPRLSFNASPPPTHTLFCPPPPSRSFTLESKPLMDRAEYCWMCLTQSLVNCMNGCTFVLLPWDMMRWILCRHVHREMPSVFFHKRGYTAAFFFCSCWCQTVSKTTKCNANLFFVVAFFKTRF